MTKIYLPLTNKDGKKDAFYSLLEFIKKYNDFIHSYDGDYSTFKSTNNNCEYSVNDDLGIVSSITLY
jgi:hypothetical protein